MLQRPENWKSWDLACRTACILCNQPKQSGGGVGQTAVSHSGTSRAQGVGSQAHHCPTRPLKSEPRGHISHSSEGQGEGREALEGDPEDTEFGDIGRIQQMC